MVNHPCPQVGHPHWKELVEKVGIFEAYKAFRDNGYEIPDPKGYSYSDIKLVEPTTEDFSHIKDFTDRYNAIAERKSELQEQGAQISGLNEYGFKWIPNQGVYQQKEASSELPNEQLDNKVKGFLKKVGVSVKNIPEGDFAGKVDTINKIIEVVDGKAGVDTLSHEATHMFLDMLPDTSPILKEIMKDVMTRPEYADIYEQYEKDPEYLNEDGSVNEEKMAKEAASHIIDDIIVGKFKEKAALKWWQKLWNWIVGKFKGKNLDAYEQVAEDVLSGYTGRLDKNKVGKGIYKQIAPDVAAKMAKERAKLKKDITEYTKATRDKASTSTEQKAVIDGVILKESTDPAIGLRPSPKVELEDADHIYKDENGIVYDSTTRKITGEFSADKAAQYELNKDIGNDIDTLLTAAVLGRSFDQIKKLTTPTLPDDYKYRLYSDLLKFVDSVTSNGEVAIPQVIVADPVSKTAGSIDLHTVDVQGNNRIYDLKTSVNEVKGGKSDTYMSEWKQNEGSVFNGLTYKDGELVPRKEGDDPVRLSKKAQHGIQTGSYGRMIELQGGPVVGLYSRHMNVELDYNNWKLKSYKDDGLVSHNIEDNKPYIDQVIPTQVDENNLSELQKNRIGYDYIPDKDPELEQMAANGEKSDTDPQPFADIPAIKSLSEAIQKFIGEKIDYLKRLKLTKSDKVHIIKDEEILNLEQLQTAIGASITKENYSSALDAYMDYTINQANAIINYADNNIHIGGKLNENYLDVLTRGKSFLEGYRDINSMVTAINANQVPKFSKSVSTLNDLEDAINEGLTDYMIEYVVSKGYQYTRDEIVDAIKGGAKDIGVLMSLFAGASASKSVLVSIVFDEIRKGIFTAYDESAVDKRVIDKIDTELKAVSPGSTDKNRTDFMINRNDMTFVQRVGPEYDRMKDAVKEALTNPGTRERYEFVPGDEEFNKDLFDKIIAYGELTEAESFVPADYDPATNIYTPGYYVDAEYCHYVPVDVYDSDGNVIKTLDYEKNRPIFEYQNNKGKWIDRPVPDSIKGIRWEKEGDKYYETKDGKQVRQLSAEEVRGIDILQKRNIYKRPVPDKYTLIFKDGKFTGQITENPEGQVKWIVKSEFKQVKDKSLSGKDLRDPKYVTIMTDNSPKGMAQRNYYTEYMKQRHLLSLKLPQVQRKAFMKYLDAIPTDEWSVAYRTGGIKAVKELAKKKGSKFLVPTSKSAKEVVIDEKGDVMRTIPTPLRGRYDEKKIKELTTKLDSVKQDLKSIALSGEARKKKVSEQKELQKKIKEEGQKAKLTDIDTDLSQSQKETADAIRLYDNKSKIESKLLTIKQIAEMKINKKKIPLTDGENRTLFVKVLHGVTEGVKAMTDSGGMTNELAQINSQLSMFLYMDDPYKDSVAAKIEGLPITLLSLRYFFLNPPIALANAQMSRFLTSWPEAAIGEFFTIKQAKEAEAIVLKAQALWIKDRPTRLAGKGPKFSSKVEAVMYEHQLTPGSQIDDKTINISMQHATEWTSMARYSVPIMKNMPIKGKDGTISNLWDIFKYNPNTSELAVDPNFKEEYDKGNWKYKVHTRVFDFQSKFEGFYHNLEKAAVTQYPFGRSAMFLKKHLPSFFIRLFSAPWVHHNLGYTEGQWTTLGSLVKDAYSYEGSIQAKMKMGMREVIPKGAIGNKDYYKLDEEGKKKADKKAYSEDKEFVNPDGSLNKEKVERDRQKRTAKLYNLKRDLAQVVSILVFWAAYQLFKALAQDDETEARRWNNYLARTFDKLRQQQMFGLPIVGLEEQYQLLKSPFASLRMIGDFGDTLNDTIGLAIPGVNSRYTTGVHKGEIKAWTKARKLIPVANLEPWWDELNSADYYRR